MIGREAIYGTRVAAVAVAALACLLALAADAEAKKKRDPLNFVLIQTDDQPPSSFNREVMPTVHRKLVGRGVNFTEAMTTTPLCCPSRAALFTGQYAHNNGVFTNFYPKLRKKKNVLPVWLQNKGYRTVHVGKFMNGYGRGRGKAAKPAPGWSDWYTGIGRDRYYNYEMSINGRKRSFGSKPKSHQTRVVTRKSVAMIRKHFRNRREQPLYLQADYYAPHGGNGGSGRCSQHTAVPLPGDQGEFEGEPLPDPPSFNEEDVSDKPSFVQAAPPLDDESIRKLSTRHRCVLESLIGVDQGVKKIVRALAKRGELRDTVVVFLTDNGFYFGEHRLASRLSSDQGGKFEPKVVPYEEAYRVPLVMRLPARVRGGDRGPAEIDLPVANIDIAPTILKLARARSCRTKRGKGCRLLDGTSLRPLLAGKTTALDDERGLLVEYRGRGNLPVCAYAGVIEPDRTYVEHTQIRLENGGCQPTDEREHYDLTDDPFQLENLFPASPLSEREAEQEALAARLDVLRDCAGAPGSAPKPGRPLCE